MMILSLFDNLISLLKVFVLGREIMLYVLMLLLLLY